MATVILREIDAGNWRQVAALRTDSGQEEFVAPNLHSLAEAKYGISPEYSHLTVVPLAIYDGEQLVGFVMYNTSPERDRFFIMRLMVDVAYQGKGYGRAALQILLERFRANPEAKEVAISYQPGNEPGRFGNLWRWQYRNHRCDSDRCAVQDRYPVQAERYLGTRVSEVDAEHRHVVGEVGERSRRDQRSPRPGRSGRQRR